MRPSDVPTYVEAGAADLGVTGKDVLLEQLAHAPGERGRDVYELLDLGFGRCTMVLASKAGPDPALESLRRLGVMRVATKYPRIAARYLEETGRQGEIVEVKGSVELAPLTGMVEAIVDLTATGTTLRENNLVVREEIVVCTARLIANPVAHKLKAAQIDALLQQLRGAHGRRRRLSDADRARRRSRELERSAARPAWQRTCARSCPTATRSRAGARDRRARPRRAATRRCSTTRASSTPTASSRRRCCVAPEELDEAIKRMPLELVAGLQVTIANVAQVADAGVGRDATVDAAAGPADRAARDAGRLGGDLRPGRPRAVPEHGRDGRRHGARGGRARRGRVRAAGRRRRDRRGDPRRLPPVRRGARLPHGRRAGDRRARVRHGDGRARGRDRRPGQPVRAGGQAPALGDGRHRRLRRARATCWSCSAPTLASASVRAGGARHARAGRARRGQPRRGRLAGPGRDATRWRRRCERLDAELPTVRRRARSRSSQALDAAAGDRSSPTRSRPSTCS